MDDSVSRKRPRLDSNADSPVPEEDILVPQDANGTRNTAPRQLYKDISTHDKSRVHNGNQYTNNTYNGPVYQSSRHDPQAVDMQPSIRQQRKEYQDLLEFPGMNNGLDSVKTNHHNTCKWLLQRNEYLDWRDKTKFSEHQGFLWIKGNPGTGKSTIMRFAYTTIVKERQDDIIVAYFFTARGADFEKSVEAMFRSLLYQVLAKWTGDGSLFEDIEAHNPGMRTLNLARLIDVFRCVVQNLGQQRLTCFIDALDECDPRHVEAMLTCFDELGELATSEGLQFYVCFSSRHYRFPRMDKCQQIILEDQDEHHIDIAKYIRSKLKIGDSKSKLAAQIKGELQRRARGIFFWVYLVVPLLNEAYNAGRIDALRKRLDQIPDDLNDLFQEIIQKGTTDHNRLNLTLQWILFAQRPLRCEELYFAVLSELDSSAVADWDPNEVTLDVMRRFVVDSSKGLAEVTKAQKPRVQFIHETVRSYLLRDDRLPGLKIEAGSSLEGSSHDRLKRCCERYISVAQTVYPDLWIGSIYDPPQDLNFCKSVAARLPFLQYSTFSMLYHANMACGNGILQHEFVRNFDTEQWMHLNNFFQQQTTRMWCRGATNAYVFAERGLSDLLQIEIEQNTHFHPKPPEYLFNHHFGTPLGAAVHHGNERCVQLLLQNKVDPESRVTRDTTTLDLAARKGHANILTLLIDNITNSRLHLETECRLLYAAAIEGHCETVHMLLDRGANVDAIAVKLGSDKPAKYATALQAASVRGHRSIAELLLKSDADANIHGGYYGTALHAASCKGHKSIVELLLSFGAKLSPQEDAYATPMHAAAYHGKKEMVELLLDRGAEIDAEHQVIGTALHMAAYQNHAEVVEFLLSKGANVNAFIPHLSTALYIASYMGFRSISKLLLREHADVNVVAGHCGSALKAASYKGRADVVKLLLKAGANIEWQRQPAYECGANCSRPAPIWCDPIIELHLGEDDNSSTALQMAAEGGHDEVVRLLLRYGANVNAINDENQTALDMAFENHHKIVVETLIEHGGKVSDTMPTDVLFPRAADLTIYPSNHSK